MNILLSGLLILFGSVQHSEPPVVNRIEAMTDFSPQIIFNYSLFFFKQGHPLKDGAIDRYVEALKATGLFDEVKVELTQVDEGKSVDIMILPTWNKSIARFVIDEFEFEGFDEIENFSANALGQELERKGIRRGILFIKYSLDDISRKVSEAVDALYEFTIGMSRISFYIQPTGPRNVKLTISLRKKDPLTGVGGT